MNVEITHISVGRAVRIAALTSSFFVLPVALFTLLTVLLQVSWKDSWWLAPPIALGPMAIVFIVVLVVSSMAGALIATGYNFVASRWGGLEISMIETGRK